MDTAETTTATPPDVLDDMKAVADAIAASRPVPPEVAKRVRERSEKVQEQLLRQYGVREIAVDLIRQGREE
ncbi:MAG TPA: hypothetical protein VKA46_30495 [Gemmataceae bacterium]|nr:hypothetical protein [Gemmataceae bacterium]